MVAMENSGKSLISGVRLSSVVPANATREDKLEELRNVDLLMKFHYIKGVYFFRREAVEGVTIHELKEPMFPWLNLYYTTSGRIRKSQTTGRPFIKCNDGGVRIVEADCDKTVDEWLQLNDHSLHDGLVYDQVLGPDLGFTPLVFLQFTTFKCGGMSVGLSWAHVLGDAFSASAFINRWGQIMTGHMPKPLIPLPLPNLSNQIPPSISHKPSSVKKVNPIGDSWITANTCKMETHSFHFTSQQLNQMISTIHDLTEPNKFSHFETLSSIIWKSLSKIRDDSGPRTVTICTNVNRNRENLVQMNGMEISTIEADFTVSKSDEAELANLIREKRVIENGVIEEIVEKENGEVDLIVYGANLTFVNLEEADLYGLELNGQRPVLVNYGINGVGDEGAVLVLPGPKDSDERSGDGRTVTVILPENQLGPLKHYLRHEWSVV